MAFAALAGQTIGAQGPAAPRRLAIVARKKILRPLCVTVAVRANVLLILKTMGADISMRMARVYMEAVLEGQ